MKLLLFCRKDIIAWGLAATMLLRPPSLCLADCENDCKAKFSDDVARCAAVLSVDLKVCNATFLAEFTGCENRRDSDLLNCYTTYQRQIDICDKSWGAASALALAAYTARVVQCGASGPLVLKCEAAAFAAFLLAIAAAKLAHEICLARQAAVFGECKELAFTNYDACKESARQKWRACHDDAARRYSDCCAAASDAQAKCIAGCRQG